MHESETTALFVLVTSWHDGNKVQFRILIDIEDFDGIEGFFVIIEKTCFILIPWLLPADILSPNRSTRLHLQTSILENPISYFNIIDRDTMYLYAESCIYKKS